MTKLPVIKPNQKPTVDKEYFKYKELKTGSFWEPYFSASEDEFLNHLWQARNSITKVSKLSEFISRAMPGAAGKAFVKDVEEGIEKATMSIRISPYVLSLINWEDPYNDPLRIQFLPTKSNMLPDHPGLTLDSLNEQEDSPVSGLTHRYPDKALFLPLNTCPVYCRFCTRSYAIGPDSEQVEKLNLRVNQQRWEEAFEYIASRPELEDIVISGGDAYNLKPAQITEIGNRLLEIDNIRRFRFATKGPAILPMKLITHNEWTDALCAVVERGRKMGKDVALHTHFNNSNEITEISQRALQVLFGEGVYVRNQSVLQRGVNDNPEEMTLLVKRLSHINVHPYYVYMHDLVKSVEDLRTSVGDALNIEKIVRGTTAGFNTPNFVVDAPGGGGKRLLSSFEYYDKDLGISVYKAPSVKKDTSFYYFDPIHTLSKYGKNKWANNTKEKLLSTIVM